MKDAGAIALILDTQGAIVLNQEEVIAFSEENNIAILGI